MLHSIGKKPSADDLVDLLAECHVRIRTFGALAVALGEREDAPEADVLDGCARVRRYFVEALPLHVRDEEDSVTPRLAGRAAEVDAALAQMRAEHDAHAAPLSAMLAALSEVERCPGGVAERAALRDAARALVSVFEPHLAAEERVIFPALRALVPAAEQAAAVVELRARRNT